MPEYEGTLKIEDIARITFTSPDMTCSGTCSVGYAAKDISVQAVLNLEGAEGGYMFDGMIGTNGINLQVMGDAGRGTIKGPSISQAPIYIQGGMKIEKPKE